MIRAQLVAKGTRAEIDRLVDRLQRDLIALGYRDLEAPVIEERADGLHLVVAQVVRK